jgi:hypothetical protein
VNRRIRTLTVGAVAGLSLLAPVAATAQTGSAGSSGTSADTRTAAVDRCDVATVKTHITAAIDRRLTTLGTLTTRTTDARGLTASDRSTLQSQLAAEKSGLTSLRSHVAADTDCASLRTDAKSVVETYRVYLLMAPKVHLVIAADSVTAIVNSTKLADAEARLQDGIDKRKGAGKDMTQAQAQLDDMKAKVAAAQSAVASVSSSVINLEPSGYPGNRPAILAARDSVRAGRADLRAARADARAVIAALRAA